MRTRLPPFSSVRAFEAAARHLSFKAAAEELHVSQSAISHQIHNLELFLHAPLFIRQPHGVELNPLGESYLRQLTPLREIIVSGRRADSSYRRGLAKAYRHRG